MLPNFINQVLRYQDQFHWNYGALCWPTLCELSAQVLPSDRHRTILPKHPWHMDPPTWKFLHPYYNTGWRLSQAHWYYHAIHLLGDNITYAIGHARRPERNSNSLPSRNNRTILATLRQTWWSLSYTPKPSQYGYSPLKNGSRRCN